MSLSCGSCSLFAGFVLWAELLHLKASVVQDKEIYRWPIKESIKAMLAWEWTIEKARDGEGEAEKKAAAATTSTRKISQTAQVREEPKTCKTTVFPIWLKTEGFL